MPESFSSPSNPNQDHSQPSPLQRFLVCLSPNPAAKNLVETVGKTAQGMNAEWYALFVDTPSHADCSSRDKDYLSRSLLTAEQLGAKTFKVYGLNVAGEIINFARRHNITAIFLGKAGRKKWSDFVGRSLTSRLMHDLKEVDFHLLTLARTTSKPPPKSSPWSLTRLRLDYFLAAAGVALCTVLALLAFPYLPLSNLVMFYLLTVVIIAVLSDRGPAIFAYFLSAGCCAFFLVPPYFSFYMEDFEHAFTLGVMLLVTTLISALTVRVRHQAKVARQQEWQTTALYEMNQILAGKTGLEELLPAAADQISRLFDRKVSILLPQTKNNLILWAGEPLPPDDVRESMVARWVFKNGHLAGAGTDTLPRVKGLYLPLVTSEGQVLGVLRLERESSQQSKNIDIEYLRLLEALSNQLALAIERENLSQQTKLSQLQIETERLRNTLLSSVSHDLRTPLTVIAGSASSLLETAENLEPQTRIELIQTIFEEATRLDRLVHNLLEISRLQSGAINLNQEWHVLEEVIGCALSQLDTQLQQHPVVINLPPDLPLVQMDALLMERVFINLLENAAKYTPPGTTLEINGTATEDGLHLDIIDHGPGLPPGQEEKIFEKFYQVRPGATRGAGLGLAICRSIIEAHGGTIGAANRPGGGAKFFFTLPLTIEPPDWQDHRLNLEQSSEIEA